MNILNVTCNDPGLQNVLAIFKRVLTLIQIIGPIVCIISLIILFINLMSNPEEKKTLAKVRNAVIALVLVFFIPLLVNVCMGLVSEDTDLGACWKNANSKMNTNSTYITTEGKKSHIIPDPDSYEPGEERSSTNSSSTPNNNGNSNSGGGANKIIFIGDSRTVQMYAYLSNDWDGANYTSGGVHVVGSDVYVAQSSMGLNWMKSTGVPAVKQYFQSGSAIVILMGVNDLYNASNYISYLNSNVSSWSSSGAKVYFASVMPCNGSYSGHNSKIDNFNTKLKSGLDSSIGWIDTNAYLVSSGYKTTDGLHYEGTTYRKIHDYIKSKV